MERFNIGKQEIFKLEIDQDAKTSFLEMARWTKFLAILGFVVLGLIMSIGIIFSIYLPTFAESMGGPSATAISSLGAAGPLLVIAFFLVFAAVEIYPIYALFKFSSSIKKALNTDSKEQFNSAIRHLKHMFKYFGILAIIVLALYGIQICLAILGSVGK